MVSSANSSARLLRGSTPSSHQLQDFRESSDCVWTRWETETLLDEVKAQKGAHSDDLNWEAIAAKVGHGKTPANCHDWYSFLKSLSERHSDLLISSKIRRFRRRATEIDRVFNCYLEGCDKSYGSERSLRQHFQLKHPEEVYSRAYMKSGARLRPKGRRNSDPSSNSAKVTSRPSSTNTSRSNSWDIGHPEATAEPEPVPGPGAISAHPDHFPHPANDQHLMPMPLPAPSEMVPVGMDGRGFHFPPQQLPQWPIPSQYGPGPNSMPWGGRGHILPPPGSLVPGPNMHMPHGMPQIDPSFSQRPSYWVPPPSSRLPHGPGGLGDPKGLMPFPQGPGVPPEAYSQNP